MEEDEPDDDGNEDDQAVEVCVGLHGLYFL